MNNHKDKARRKYERNRWRGKSEIKD